MYGTLLIMQCSEAATFLGGPAPEVQGPGADSSSDQIGSAPAPTKLGRLRLHTLKFAILSSYKVNY